MILIEPGNDACSDTGSDVEGKYSTDLFVNRMKDILKEHKMKEKLGEGAPWFTYLSFQAVHEPLQVNLLNEFYQQQQINHKSKN